MGHEGWPAVMSGLRFDNSIPFSGLKFGPEIISPASMLAVFQLVHFCTSIEAQTGACAGTPSGMRDTEDQRRTS